MYLLPAYLITQGSFWENGVELKTHATFEYDHRPTSNDDGLDQWSNEADNQKTTTTGRTNTKRLFKYFPKASRLHNQKIHSYGTLRSS